MRNGYIVPLAAFIIAVAASLRRSDAQMGIITPWNDTVKIENVFYSDREKYDSAMQAYTASLEEIQEACDRYERGCESVRMAPEKRGRVMLGCEPKDYSYPPFPSSPPEPGVTHEPKIEWKYCGNGLGNLGLRCTDWSEIEKLLVKGRVAPYRGNEYFIEYTDAPENRIRLSEYQEEFVRKIMEICEEYEEFYGAMPSAISYTGRMTEDGFYWFRPEFNSPPQSPETENEIERPYDVSEAKIFSPRPLAASSIDRGKILGALSEKGDHYENLERFMYVKSGDMDAHAPVTFLEKEGFCGMESCVQDGLVPNAEAYRQAVCLNGARERRIAEK